MLVTLLAIYFQCRQVTCQYVYSKGSHTRIIKDSHQFLDMRRPSRVSLNFVETVFCGICIVRLSEAKGLALRFIFLYAVT